MSTVFLVKDPKFRPIKSYEALLWTLVFLEKGVNFQPIRGVKALFSRF